MSDTRIYCEKCKTLHEPNFHTDREVIGAEVYNNAFAERTPTQTAMDAQWPDELVKSFAADPGTPNTKGSNPKDVAAVFRLPMALVSPYMKMYTSVAKYLGKLKYGAWNWRAGGAVASIYKSALERHVDCWWEGEDMDSDGTPHLANALACLAILIEAKELNVLVDDRPPSSAHKLHKCRAELESMMKTIYQLYGDRKPKDWTIEDEVEFL